MAGGFKVGLSREQDIKFPLFFSSSNKILVIVQKKKIITLLVNI